LQVQGTQSRSRTGQGGRMTGLKRLQIDVHCATAQALEQTRAAGC